MAETVARARDAGKGATWEVNLGPLSFGSRGLDLKPQFKVGAASANFSAELGLSDVRNGLRIAAKAEAKVEARAQGRSLSALHSSVHCETPGFREALKVAKGLLASGSAARGRIAEALGLGAAQLDAALPAEAPGEEPLLLRVKAAVALGTSAELRLGWCDTQGYHMLGAGGSAAAAVSLGANVFAGKHASGASARVLLGIGNFDFEYTFPLGSVGGPAAQAEPCAAAAATPAPAAPEAQPAQSVDLLGLGP